MSQAAPAAAALDLTACDREPIHILGSIQPHGVLLALRGPDLGIEQASANARELVGGRGERLVGRKLPDALPWLDEAVGPALRAEPHRQGAAFLRTVRAETVPGRPTFEVAAHRSGDLTIVELEDAGRGDEAGRSLDTLYPELAAFVEELREAGSAVELCGLVARAIRRITGFDRALVYRFDRDWHGTVMAEDRNDRLPSYLGLRFPASDIPAQARDLYRRNPLRIIPDASYVPVPIEPAGSRDGEPLDLSHAVLRSVSPVHLEYMRNMGTPASMSVSVLVDGELWGLVSCHNAAPRRVPLQARNACEFLTRIFALQLAAGQRSAEAEERLRLGAIGARLLGYMAGEDFFLDGLLNNPGDALALAEATGAAIVTPDRCWLLGVTPPEAAVRDLQAWFTAKHGTEEVFATDALGGVYPAFAASAEASGLLAISISKRLASHVLWFRPEIVQTVSWGGDPRKPVAPDGSGPEGRLRPRRSFEIWKEIVRGRSLPWSAATLDAARELRNAVLGIVLRRAEDLAALTEELQQSNRELEAFSYSVSHDLRAPFRHIVGYSELLRSREGDRLSDQGRRYVDTIVEAAFSAGTLVDNLLSFSQMGRNALNRMTSDMNALVGEVRRSISREIPAERAVEWRVGALGQVFADPVMLRLAIENLLSNAIKYTRGREPAVIEIDRLGPDEDGQATFFVRDNGAGFDMAYVGKLFGVFQRLHRIEEYEGTGIGLANVRRIVERHGGRVWAEGEVGRGATFFFTLPTSEERS